MSSTPLFDSLRQHRALPAPTAPAPAPRATAAFASAPGGTALPPLAAVRERPVPASPLDAPALVPGASPTSIDERDDTEVPARLVSAIDAIPSQLRTTLAREHIVEPEHLQFVEAVADALTRAVVDAVVAELDRIAASGVVRG